MRCGAVLAGVALAAVVTVATADPAAAKGLAEGVVEGEGLDDPIELDFGTLDELGLDHRDFGFDEMVHGAGDIPAPPAVLLEAAPTSSLGPELRVTWNVYGQRGKVAQDLYPYASGGPLLHTLSGQMYHDYEMRSGWFVADQELLTSLQEVGLPEEAELVENAAAKADPASHPGRGPVTGSGAPSADASGSGSWWPPVGAALVAVPLVAGAVLTARAWARGRRRRPASVI